MKEILLIFAVLCIFQLIQDNVPPNINNIVNIVLAVIATVLYFVL